MTPLLIVLIVLVVLAGIALLAAIGLLLEVLPRLAAKKMRSGPIDEAALSYPESYDELRGRVTVQKDLAYPSKFPANKFDLYLPKDADRAHPLPLVVWIHGGGFIAGEMEGTENVMTCLAAAGYAAISLDYPVAPEHRYPAALHAIDAFFAFLPRLSERCPIDLTRIVLGGDSAGAQLAAQFAAKETNAELSAQMRLPRRLSSPLKGIALVSGPFDLPALRRYAKTHDKKFLFLVDLWGRAYFGKLFWHRSSRGEGDGHRAASHARLPARLSHRWQRGQLRGAKPRLGRSPAPERHPRQRALLCKGRRHRPPRLSLPPCGSTSKRGP